MRKAQVSMEFVFLVSLAFMVMLVFISSTRSEFDDLISEEERSLLKDLSLTIQQEIIIASSVNDGYQRTFTLPSDLEGNDYNVQITSNTLTTSTDEYEFELNIPNTMGNIQKGDNIINKTDGVLYLN